MVLLCAISVYYIHTMFFIFYKTYLKRKVFFYFFFILVIFRSNLGICNPASDNKQFTIVFSGEENGYIKPCGCTEGQLGGINRRYLAIDSIKKEKHFVLPVSLGDIPGNPNRQNEIKMEIMINAMEMMEYVVHNIGEKDIAMGYNILHYFSQISNIAFISSNIKFNDNINNAIKPYLIKAIKIKNSEVKIAFLGILSPYLVENDLYNIEILDPEESLKPIIDSIRKKAGIDLIVLLSHAEKEETLEIADIFSELDLIITGHELDDPNIYVKKINNTIITSAGKSGKHIGAITFSNENGEWKTLANENGEFVKKISLSPEFNKPSNIDNLIDLYKNKVKEEDLFRKHQRIMSGQGEEYAGSLMCGSCHLKIYQHWKNTKHSKAFETLEENEDQFDPECIKCHVVGFDYSAGFVSLDETPDLKGVGCESCHGYGSAHILDTSIPYNTVYKTECIKCHDSENSPHFEYDSYWEEIKHPADN